jgi:hypothetical protein
VCESCLTALVIWRQVAGTMGYRRQRRHSLARDVLSSSALSPWSLSIRLAPPEADATGAETAAAAMIGGVPTAWVSSR